MGNTPTARPNRVRHSALSRRKHSRRLSAWLASMVAKLTGTGTQITVDQAYGDGTSGATGGQAAHATVAFPDVPDNLDYVVIAGKTYTFYTTLTGHQTEDGAVLIGADGAECKANLVAAINLAAGGGTTYSSATTEHPTVADVAGTLEAKSHGFAGNALQILSSSANITVTGETAPGPGVPTTFTAGLEDWSIQVSEGVHGWTDGQGPFLLTGTHADYGLDLSVFYYAIVLSSTTIRLATSRDAAIARTYVTWNQMEIDRPLLMRTAAESSSAIFEQLRSGKSYMRLSAGSDMDTI